MAVNGSAGKRKTGGYFSGWIVCVAGPQYGRDFKLFYGFNRIGSSGKTDIMIEGDAGIAANEHCSVVYDKRSARFFPCPGKDTETFLNGEKVENSEELNIYDEIRLGESVFEFIPFCRKDRQWQ